MCGIAGFSLRKGSKVNSRALAHHLLTAIEARGSHASGFAFITPDDLGVYKDAKPGSQLPMYQLPRRARNVILHTRYATQGSPKVNENNHPVISPDGTIALTHNGVISNDYKFRMHRAGNVTNIEDRFENLPQVDSAVIPALIQKYGARGVEKLQGYAALAWLDEASPIRETIHLARIDSSPVHYTWLEDGSFVYASTEALLVKALDAMNLPYGGILHMDEGEYFTITNGWIMDREDDLFMEEDEWTKWRYSGATAGGHSRTTSAPPSTPSTNVTRPSTSTPVGTPRTIVPQPTTPAKAVASGKGSEDGGATADFGEGSTVRSGAAYIPSTFGAVQFSDGSDAIEDDDDLYSWEDDMALRLGEAFACTADDNSGKALALIPESNEPTDLEGYYLVTEDDNIEMMESVDKLEDRLEWYSNMALWDNPPFPQAEQKLRWVNFIKDVGHISKRDGMMSWVEDLAQIDAHESPAVYNLDGVRDGLGMLITANAI